MFNFFVSFTLKEPGPHYDRVVSAIQEAGISAQLTPTLFYVKSDMARDDFAGKMLYVTMGKEPLVDKLILIDASSNACETYNIDPAVTKPMTENWHN